MNLKALFEKFCASFTHHEVTGTIHGDTGVLKEFMGEVTDRIHALEAKIEALPGQGREVVEGELAKLRQETAPQKFVKGADGEARQVPLDAEKNADAAEG